MAAKCGVNCVIRAGLAWRLEAPDVMRASIAVRDPQWARRCYETLVHWSESEGLVRYREDGGQDEFEHGCVLDGWQMPTETEAEAIIEELRHLDGVDDPHGEPN